jgi:hypothetical protein
MNYKYLTIFLALTFLLLTAGSVILAQTSASFNLEWHVIGSGGGESSWDGYQVKGTIGQSIASQPASGSANFTVSSGYWFGDTGPAGTTGTGIYLPIIFKN